MNPKSKNFDQAKPGEVFYFKSDDDEYTVVQSVNLDTASFICSCESEKIALYLVTRLNTPDAKKKLERLTK